MLCARPFSMTAMKCVIILAVLLTLGGAASAQQRDTAKASAVSKTDAEPSRDDFVDVEEEPEAIVPVEKLIHYPDSAIHAGIQGKVSIQALIAADGHVEKVEVIKADDEIFRQPSIDAMMQAKFTPAKQHGKPLRVWITRTINFKLK